MLFCNKTILCFFFPSAILGVRAISSSTHSPTQPPSSPLDCSFLSSHFPLSLQDFIFLKFIYNHTFCAGALPFLLPREKPPSSVPNLTSGCLVCIAATGLWVLCFSCSSGITACSVTSFGMAGKPASSWLSFTLKGTARQSWLLFAPRQQ